MTIPDHIGIYLIKSMSYPKCRHVTTIIVYLTCRQVATLYNEEVHDD